MFIDCISYKFLQHLEIKAEVLNEVQKADLLLHNYYYPTAVCVNMQQLLQRGKTKRKKKNVFKLSRGINAANNLYEFALCNWQPTNL